MQVIVGEEEGEREGMEVGEVVGGSGRGKEKI